MLLGICNTVNDSIAMIKLRRHDSERRGGTRPRDQGSRGRTWEDMHDESFKVDFAGNHFKFWRE